MKLIIDSFHYVEPPDGLFGALINDTWVGMVGMTVKKASWIITLLKKTRSFNSSSFCCRKWI